MSLDGGAYFPFANGRCHFLAVDATTGNQALSDNECQVEHFLSALKMAATKGTTATAAWSTEQKVACSGFSPFITLCPTWRNRTNPRRVWKLRTPWTLLTDEPHRIEESQEKPRIGKAYQYFHLNNICFAYLHRNCGASNYQKTSMYKVIFFLLIFTCLSITNKILRTRLHKTQPFFVFQSI